MNAVIYARYSSDKQREESIEGQIRECRQYAEKNGIRIVGEYIDRALSASKHTEKRLDFHRMISDSDKKQFEAVLVWKLDRFSRNRYDSVLNKKLLSENGVKVISVTEQISDGPEGVIVEALIEAMAQHYSAELSQKIHRGQKENALKGRNNGGGIPLGYALGEDQHLVIDPLTSPVVKEIYQRYADGWTIKEICNDLNQRGIRTASGGEFKSSSFNVLLQNRKYIGEYRYQDVVIPDGVPAIVSEDVFEQVQARRNRNKHAPAATKATEQFLLTTKLFCGECGCKMVGESGTSKTGTVYHYYKCQAAKKKHTCRKKPVRKAWIEDLVVREIMSRVFDDTVMDKLAEDLFALQSEEPFEIRILEKELAEIEKKIDNLLRAIEDGIRTESTKTRLENLETQKIETTEKLTHARIKSPTYTKEQIVLFLNRFRSVDLSDFKSKQMLIDKFVDSIFVYDDKIILTLRYRDDIEEISFEKSNSSDLERCCPPNRKRRALARLFAVVLRSGILKKSVVMCHFFFIFLSDFRKENRKVVYNYLSFA